MGEQPGAGRGHSFKIKGHSRQRKVAKPYSRPSDRKKGVLESVRDFFSPSWLLDFWKGNKIAEEHEIEDFDDVNDGEEPTGFNQDFSGQSRLMEGPGLSSTFGQMSAVGRRNELLGNGGTGLMASVHQRSQTSHDPGLSALLAVRCREPLNKKAFDTRTAAFTSSSGECTRSIENRSSSLVESADTQEGETSTQVQSPSEPSPILSSSQSKARSSVVFSTSLLVGSSSTPVTSQTTSGLSLLSSERCTTSSRIHDNPGPSRLSSDTLSSSSTPQSTPVLFSERSSTSSRPQPTSVFRGKPEFSLSAFGSVLPSKSTSQSPRYSSPYYSGKTIFGGASSQVSKTGKRARISSPGSSETSKPIKRQIRPTPLAGTSGGVASQTAKRILEALEKMSSPLEDAKKIPPSPPFGTSSLSPLSFTSKRRKAPPQPYNKPIGSPRKLQAQFGGPPVQSLSVPRRAVISRIHPTTGTKPSATQTSSAQSTTVLTGTSSSKVKPTQSFVPTPLPMSLSPMETSKGGGGGKMKTSKTNTTHYKSRTPDEQEHEVTNPLPVITSAIPLTIPSGSSMPSFALSSPSSTSSKVKDQTESVPYLQSKSPDISSNNFKFSAPEPRKPSSNKTLSKLSSQQKMQYSFSKPAPVNNSENNTSSPVKSPVLDSLDKFKPAQGSWDCSECFVNNKPDASTCVACTTPKPSSSAQKSTSNALKPMLTTSKLTQLPSNDLFKQLQQPSGLFTNKQEDKKDTSLTKDKQKPDVVQAKDTLFKQFAPPSDSWECPSCMLNNKAQDLKCVCCQEQKPGEKTSKTTDNLISNQTTSDEGSRTCDSSSSTTSSFTGGFKILSETKPQNSPFTFGSVDNKVGNKVTFGSSSSSSSDATSTAAVSFVFGAPSTSSSSEKTYMFGSATTSKNLQPTSTDSANSTFKFGSRNESTKLIPSFEFGKGPELKSSDATTTFSFGSTSASTDKTPALAFGSSAKKDTDNPTSITFGGNNIEVKNPTKTDSAIEKESPKKPNLTTQETKKVGSIAQAAAAGLLKIPSSVDVVDLTSDALSKPNQDAAPPNVNLFAGKSIANTAALFSFPKEAKLPTSSALPSLPFAFGASSAKPQAESAKVPPSFAFTASTASSNIPKFGEATASNVTTSAPTQGFQFGASLDSTVKPAGGTQSIFSAPSASPGFPNTSANTATTSPFVFKGSTDNTEKFGNKLSTSSAGFAFGQTTGKSSFSFSNSATTKSESSTTGSTSAPFVFGAANSQKSSGFNFGSSTQQPFAFANTNTSPPVGLPGAVSEESMDADGNNNNNNSQPAVTPFGSTLAPVTQVAAAPFSFTQTPSNTGFSFGSVQQPGSFKFGDTTSTLPLFGGSSSPAFGGSTGTPLQQGTGSGFNFGSPATNSAGSQSGAFNFSGGSTSAFTAGSGTATKRVIKRGIRRTRR